MTEDCAVRAVSVMVRIASRTARVRRLLIPAVYTTCGRVVTECRNELGGEFRTVHLFARRGIRLRALPRLKPVAHAAHGQEVLRVARLRLDVLAQARHEV